jgi:regulator of nucleoside diphosphate kinase
LSRIIYITQNDRDRLKKLIDETLSQTVERKRPIQDLDREIDKAQVVEGKNLPGDVVTMNSRVLLLINGAEKEVTLVYPAEADLISNKISVLSPIGTAILGYREGDTVEWEVPSGVKQVQIQRILYQPEAAGDYHL